MKKLLLASAFALAFTGAALASGSRHGGSQTGNNGGGNGGCGVGQQTNGCGSNNPITNQPVLNFSLSAGGGAAAVGQSLNTHATGFQSNLNTNNTHALGNTVGGVQTSAIGEGGAGTNVPQQGGGVVQTPAWSNAYGGVQAGLTSTSGSYTNGTGTANHTTGGSASGYAGGIGAGVSLNGAIGNRN